MLRQLSSKSDTKNFDRDADDDGYFHVDVEKLDAEENDNNLLQDAPDEPRTVQGAIRNLSSLVDESELNIDSRIMGKILADVGENGYRIQGISVWIVNDDTHRLEPCHGGWWHNKDTLPESEALSRLVDPSCKNHVPPTAVSPGVDIAGLLWTKSKKGVNMRSLMRRMSSVAFYNTSSNALFSSSRNVLAGQQGDENNDDNNNPTIHNKLIFRDLKSLVNDPDTAKGPRLTLLEQAGFGQATGVPFETSISKGLVVFLCESNVDEDLLKGLPNTTYLRQAAQFVGSCISMGDARRAGVGQRLQIEKSAGRSSRDLHGSTNTRETPATRKSENASEQDHEQTETTSVQTWIPQKLKVWGNKIKGGGMQVPPALSVKESLLTAFGAFIGLLVLSSLNEYYKYLSDEEFFLLIGPFGALMTLQYGLTAAPASQPRNAIMGQVTSGAVSLAFTYIPESLLPVWIRRAVGPALGIATMVKLGFTHPPAGAHAVLYASGRYGWVFYSLVVLSTVLSVIPATFINNMSPRRQYPTYWGLNRPKWAQGFCSKKNGKANGSVYDA